jgi:hypothetical protein
MHAVVLAYVLIGFANNPMLLEIVSVDRQLCNV